MGDLHESPWRFFYMGCSLWGLFGLISYIVILLMIRKYRLPGTRGGPNCFLSFMILFVLGPIPLVLLAIDSQNARRQKPKPSPSEYWASGKMNRTWSQDREKK